MMGRSHVKQGACAITLSATVLTATGLLPVQTWETYPNIAIVAVGLILGGAAAPDLDANGSSASRSFGPMTRLLSLLTRVATRGMYWATRGRRDKPGAGSHRLLTHTALGNLMGGGILAAVCSIVTPYGPIPAAIALGMYAGIGAFTIKNNRRLYGIRYKWWAALIVGAVAYRTDGVDSKWLLVWAGALAFGCAVHCFGDSCTQHGTPYWWPLQQNGKRWGTHHVLPANMRIRTGSLQEPVIMFFCYLLTVGTCGLIIYLRMRG
jgi:membrane-bound metal-dependent hydrolase YbcI (DUF457 family)